MTPRTLLDKIWDEHRIGDPSAGGDDLLYIDLHLLHEVTSPQAFEGLRHAGRTVRRPDLTLATVDHVVPSTGRSEDWADEQATEMVQRLGASCAEAGVPLLDIRDPRQGIVHVVAPEQGLTQPGMTIVCGDSHTSTHGAFGALAFGIGTSEVEHVLATQTLPQARPLAMAVEVDGALPAGCGAKDLALALFAQIGVGGATGHVIEYRGAAISRLSMEGRMTLCNLSIEAGARAALVAPDRTTEAYLRGRPFAPRGLDWEGAVASWRRLASDPGASFDRTMALDASAVRPRATWGNNPAQNVALDEPIPDPDRLEDPVRRGQARRALDYMGLEPGWPLSRVPVDVVFIGSCTNGRIEDLREAAAVVAGRRIAAGVTALVVPGSGPVKQQAEAEGLDRAFEAAGFSWREPGCSMCLGMNADVLRPGQRCASTSNRNFENRQGPGGRTHLVGPAVAAATAITGRLTDPREVSP